MLSSEANLFNRKEIIDKQNKLKKLYELHKDDPETEYLCINLGFTVKSNINTSFTP